MIRLVLILTAVFCVAEAEVFAGERPNIVLILVDDLGWKDIGCYGNDFVETPRIDRLAAEGVRFTDFYAAGAVCSPTRYALQSGQNQARIGITTHIPGHWRPFERVITPRPTMAMPRDTVTIAESLKAAGYTTGYVGKWHLGSGASFQPDQQGYDFSAVINGPHMPERYRVQEPSDLKPKPGQYRTEFEADLSIDFIRRNKDDPFFLMLSPYAVHIPLEAMPDKVEKYRKKAQAMDRQLPHHVYAAMIEHCDDMVGRVIDAVEAEGLTDETMIVFTSDNGGLFRRNNYREGVDDSVTTAAPLRGEKGTLYEGGVRVPLIVKYPPLTKPGTVSSEPSISYDFHPTFVELAGGSLPENQTIDGLSLVTLFDDPEAALNRDALYWHLPHYHHDRPSSSIRRGKWKLIEYIDGTNDLELYNLSEDIGESNNLAGERQAMAASLRQNLAQWRQEVVATMPTPNPCYNPERADEWWNVRTGEPLDRNRRNATNNSRKDKKP